MQTITSLRCLRCLLFNAALLLSSELAFGQAQPDAAAKAAIVAPFLDDQTLLVARLDLRQIDAAEAVKVLGRLAPPDDSEFPKHLAKMEQRANELLQALTSTGLSELYAVVSLTDLPKESPFIVAPLKTAAEMQPGLPLLRQLLRFEEAEIRSRAVVMGKSSTIQRLKTLRPTARPELARGFERTGDAALQIVVCPSDDTRRVLREMLPRLPDEVGGGSGKTLAEGVQWVAVSVQAPPRLSLSATIQSRDPESAAAVRGMIVSALQLLGKQAEIRRQWPQVDDLARLMTPRLSGDQLLLNISDKSSEMEQVLRLAVTPLQAVRTAAGRRASFDNLKHLGLAMHSYHDVHGRLPPQAIRGKDGRALLSWRVAILPYLEAEPLYKQFRLDEPWDSEHNKNLIAKMPAVFASPSLGDERRTRGLTSYLAPLTRQPPATPPPPTDDAKQPVQRGKDETIFDRATGMKFQQVTDGLSNTILVLEAHPNSAVTWTKPDDLMMDQNDLLKHLRGQPNDGFCCVFCDGSAHFLKNFLDPTTLWRLLLMNDGQPIGDIH